MYIQLLECSTYTTFPWCLHYLELSWNLDQPESHQSSRNNMKLVCEMTSILIERTSGIPMSNKKNYFFSGSCHAKNRKWQFKTEILSGELSLIGIIIIQLQNCFFITVSLPSKDDICQSVSILHFYLSFIFIIIFTHVNGAGWDVNLLTFLQLS